MQPRPLNYPTLLLTTPPLPSLATHFVILSAAQRSRNISVSLGIRGYASLVGHCWVRPAAFVGSVGYIGSVGSVGYTEDPHLTHLTYLTHLTHYTHSVVNTVEEKNITKSPHRSEGIGTKTFGI